MDKSPERRYRNGLDFASDLSTLFSHLERPQSDISFQEKFDYVRELDFFRGFLDSEIWKIIRASTWQEVDLGERIVQEGDIDDAFFIITAGRVEVSKNGEVLQELFEGDCFGEMGCLNKIQRTASIVAIVPVSLKKVNSTLIEQVTTDCKLRFYGVFLRVLIERLRNTTERVVGSRATGRDSHVS